MFITVLFIISDNRKCSKCSPADEQINKRQQTYTMENYSEMKVNKSLIHVTNKFRKSILRSSISILQNSICKTFRKDNLQGQEAGQGFPGWDGRRGVRNNWLQSSPRELIREVESSNILITLEVTQLNIFIKTHETDTSQLHFIVCKLYSIYHLCLIELHLIKKQAMLWKNKRADGDVGEIFLLKVKSLYKIMGRLQTAQDLSKQFMQYKKKYEDVK